MFLHTNFYATFQAHYFYQNRSIIKLFFQKKMQYLRTPHTPFPAAARGFLLRAPIISGGWGTRPPKQPPIIGFEQAMRLLCRYLRFWFKNKNNRRTSARNCFSMLNFMSCVLTALGACKTKTVNYNKLNVSFRDLKTTNKILNVFDLGKCKFFSNLCRLGMFHSFDEDNG